MYMEDVWHNQADEFDLFEYEGKSYPIKWYGGTLFATEDLENAILDEQGHCKDDKATYMDEKIAFYFSDNQFNNKTGKQLYEWYGKAL